MRTLSFVCVLAIAICGVAHVHAADAEKDHKKPVKSASSKETQKQLTDAGKTKKPVKELPEKVNEKFHHDGHFGKDTIKAIYSVGKDLWWVEVTDGGKDFLLEYDNSGALLAIAWENPNGSLVILTEGDDGYLWAVDEDGNAVAWH